jgi:hypothetical protein
MSNDKVRNLFDRITAYGLDRYVNAIKTTYKDIKIDADGFDDEYEIKCIVTKIQYIIIALANEAWNIKDNGNISIETIKDKDTQTEKVTRVGRENTITWIDVCECLYDYVMETGKCTIMIYADIRIHPVAPPKVKVEIKFDIKRGKFIIYNTGSNAARRKDILRRIEVDSGSFYDIDKHGDVINDDDSFDDFMDSYFKSRGSSLGISSGPSSVSSLASDSV